MTHPLIQSGFGIFSFLSSELTNVVQKSLDYTLFDAKFIHIVSVFGIVQESVFLKKIGQGAPLNRGSHMRRP